MIFSLENLLRRLRIKQVIKFVGGGKVLDIGCGRDFVFLILIQKTIESGYGTDKKLDNFSLGNINLFGLEMDKDDLPKEMNMLLNQVFMLASLEHFDYPGKVLSKAYIALRPGGEIYITTPSKIAKPVLILLAVLGLVDREEIYDHKRYFSKAELVTCIESAGFKEVMHKYFEFGLNQLIIARKP